MAVMGTALVIVTAFLFAWLLARAVNYFSLDTWRRSAGQHWALRARELYPARLTAGFNALLIPVDLCLIAGLFHLPVPTWAVAVAGLLGAQTGNYPVIREIVPKSRGGPSLGRLFMAVQGLVPLALVAGAMVVMPSHFGMATWLIAGITFLLLLALRLGLAMRLFSLIRILRPAEPRLVGLISAVAQRMNVPRPDAWVSPTPLANAYAVVVRRELIFTQGIIDHLSDAQIAAICAHELGHLTEPRRLVYLRVLQSMLLFPLVFLKPLASLGAAGGPYTLGLAVLILLAAVRLRQMAQRLEIRADAIATANQGEPTAYARALEHLYQVNQMPAVMPNRRRQRHPDLYDRLLAAGITPDFPRPNPPRRLTPAGRIMFFLSVALVIVVNGHASFHG